MQQKAQAEAVPAQRSAGPTAPALVPPTGLSLKPSALVPRRAQGTSGRRPPNYPDLNFQAIGAALKLSPTYVGRILNGVSRPSMPVAERLAALMGWTIDEVNRLYGNNPKHQVLKKKSKGAAVHAKSRNGSERVAQTQNRRT